MSKSYKTITLEPLNIGITRRTKKRVWLDTKVTVIYDTRETTIKTFDTYKEANVFVKEITKQRDKNETKKQSHRANTLYTAKDIPT